MTQSNERKLTIARAMAEALAQEMRGDERVFVMGEDIGALGGVYGNTRGLLDEFGAERVRDTPISETAFIGAAVGAAQDGMRPVVELMFVDFFGVCFDAIYNLMAKNIYFSGGSVKVPMVLMTSTGGGYSDAGQHSQCVYGTFAHLPGMKVVAPSNAYDAKGLMTAAIRDDSPVVFMYHKSLQGMGWLGTHNPTDLMIIVVAILFCISAISWHGLLLSEIARLAPAGQVGPVTGASLAFATIGMMSYPTIYALLVKFTGDRSLGFYLAAAPALVMAVKLYFPPKHVEGAAV